MRLTVERDGKATVVDVADDRSAVRVGDRSFPVKVIARGPMRVELEIAGEPVVVDGWPDHQPAPPGPVDVNGERGPVSVRAEEGGGGLLAPAAPAGPPPPRPSGPASPSPSGTGPPGATAVLPPMPGRVVEVRVREGEAVAKGAVVLVLEAMKMRSEVTAPVDGVVRELRVREGSNVRAREPMLFLVPG